MICDIYTSHTDHIEKIRLDRERGATAGGWLGLWLRWRLPSGGQGGRAGRAGQGRTGSGGGPGGWRRPAARARKPRKPGGVRAPGGRGGGSRWPAPCCPGPPRRVGPGRAGFWCRVDGCREASGGARRPVTVVAGSTGSVMGGPRAGQPHSLASTAFTGGRAGPGRLRAGAGFGRSGVRAGVALAAYVGRALGGRGAGRRGRG